MADNKILVFGENAAAEDYLTDAEYSTNEIRSSGNIVGLARRKPNNKALKQGTLMASALAQVLADADSDAGWAGTEINDSLTPAGIKGIFRNYLETKIDSFTKAISLFSNERYEYDEDTDYLPTDARTYNGELYICKQANGPTNIHAPSDNAYWLKLGGNALIPNQIIQSPVPLTDANLHLLDGALLSGSGAYSAYVAMMSDLYNADPTATCWTDENSWQTSVTTYGECGKFVYDSVNNTLRLPKVVTYIMATNTATELGSLVEAGAPEIDGKFISAPAVSSAEFATNHEQWLTQAFKDSYPEISPIPARLDGGASYGSIYYDFKASNSNSIYGNSNTVQTQAIKYYHYIVVGTVSKTDIQIDIDNVMADLALKADKDFSNVTAPTQAFKDQVISWFDLDYDSAVTLSVGDFTADFSGIVICITNSSGTQITQMYQSTAKTDATCIGSHGSAGSFISYGSFIMPISKGHTYSFSNSADIKRLQAIPFTGGN